MQTVQLLEPNKIELLLSHMNEQRTQRRTVDSPMKLFRLKCLSDEGTQSPFQKMRELGPTPPSKVWPGSVEHSEEKAQSPPVTPLRFPMEHQQW